MRKGTIASHVAFRVLGQRRRDAVTKLEEAKLFKIHFTLRSGKGRFQDPTGFATSEGEAKDRADILAKMNPNRELVVIRDNAEVYRTIHRPTV